MENFLVTLNGFYFFYIIFIGLYVFRKRVQAAQSKEVSLGYFKDYQGPISPHLKVLENHFNNQFQAPVLFMIVSLFAIQTSSIHFFMNFAACGFILSRIAHSWVHLTSNKVLYRALFYFIGLFMISSMWIMILSNLTT